MPFYAVARGRSVGIYTSWNECNLNVTAFPGARFKKFSTLREAERFIQVHADPFAALEMADASTAATNFGASTSNRVIDLTGAQSSSSVVDRPLVELDIAKIQAANNPDLNEALKRIENLKRQLEEVKSENDRATGGSGTSTSPAKQPKENGFIWHGKYKFAVDSEDFVQVYINGCFKPNGHNACAGFGVYFGENHELNMSKAASGRILHNCADIQAATEAIRMAKGNGVQKLQINTSSEFLINAVTKWMARWKQNGWQTWEEEPVRNKENFMQLDAMMQTTMVIKWHRSEDLPPCMVRAFEMASKAADEQRHVQQANVAQLLYDQYMDHLDDIEYYAGYDYDGYDYDGNYDDEYENDSFIGDSEVESGSESSISSAEENDE